MYKWYQVLLQDLDENVDENLAWLTQKAEDQKSNKGNLTFPKHTVNVIELNCKVVEKVTTPYFYINPSPLFRFIVFFFKCFLKASIFIILCILKIMKMLFISCNFFLEKFSLLQFFYFLSTNLKLKCQVKLQ